MLIRQKPIPSAGLWYWDGCRPSPRRAKPWTRGTEMATAHITPHNDAVLAEIFIAAPPARVFDAIADPKQRAQWWGIKEPSGSGPSEVVPFRVIDGKSDLRVGGKWSNDGVRG